MSKVIKIKGLKEFDRLLKGLPNEVKGKVLQSVAKTAIRKTLKNALASKHKRLTKIANEKGNPTGVLFGFISRYNFMNWIEYGTNLRTRKSGGSTGKLSPKPFWGIMLNRNINNTVKEYAGSWFGIMKKFIDKNTTKR